jgi:Uma2 family endonuclease
LGRVVALHIHTIRRNFNKNEIMIGSVRPPTTMFEVWESLPEGTLCQLVNNNLIMSPSPLNVHQVVLNKINYGLLRYLENHPIGEVRIAPYDVHFSTRNIFQPDIIFISNENIHLIHETGLMGAPDLIIEILSPGTAHVDMGEKRTVYEQYGVKEYFMVEPSNKTVTSLMLQGKEFTEQESQTGVIVSKLLNTTLAF